MTKEKAEEIKTNVDNILQECYDKSKSHEFNLEEWRTEDWEKIKRVELPHNFKATGIKLNELKDIGEKITSLPDDWKFHP